MNLLTVPHRQQLQEADCLAACSAMVLAYWQYPLAYRKILKTLDTTQYGAVASRITRLAHKNLQVVYTYGSIADLRSYISKKQPVITLVLTGELPYWSYSTMHAVVVVGIDDTHVYVNDPYFEDAPQVVSIGDFDLAWLEMGNRCAIFSI